MCGKDIEPYPFSYSHPKATCLHESHDTSSPKINTSRTILLDMNETVLVTGATGTVGSEVVRQLSRYASSYDIRAGVHSIENSNKVQRYDGVKAVRLIMTNKKDLNLPSKMCDISLVPAQKQLSLE